MAEYTVKKFTLKKPNQNNPNMMQNILVDEKICFQFSGRQR